MNRLVNFFRRLFGVPYWSLSQWAKLKVKNAVNYIGAFEKALAGEARRHGADGVICGHIHYAAIRDEHGVRYMNCGDWVESCTALVEHEDGRFEIITWADLAGRAAPVARQRGSRRARRFGDLAHSACILPGPPVAHKTSCMTTQPIAGLPRISMRRRGWLRRSRCGRRCCRSPFSTNASATKVFLKPEMLQRTGSFKFRGAFNKLSSIPQDKRSGGVVAFSSGNHAQGVAAAAKILNMQATIVMPADAPLTKRERTKAYGAEVVLYDRDKEDREAIARGIAGKRGATLVRPYDDPFVIAGQGTAGREIAEDMAALGLAPDIVVAPASGGGLIAGVATAVKAKFPQAQIIVAEPKDYDDHGLSLRAGHREAHHAAGRTICDALMAAMPGEITFSINSKLLAGGVTASDEEVGAAVAFAYRELKLVVEPGGAVGLAALLAGRIDAKGKNVVIVLSGGNVDADLFAKLVA